MDQVVAHSARHRSSAQFIVMQCRRQRSNAYYRRHVSRTGRLRFLRCAWYVSILSTLKLFAEVKTDVWGTHNLDLCNKPSNVSQWQTFNSNLTNYTVPSEIIDIIGGRYVLSALLSGTIHLTVNKT
jgi:hypothetical protein